jgi:hypothetical protein
MGLLYAVRPRLRQVGSSHEETGRQLTSHLCLESRGEQQEEREETETIASQSTMGSDESVMKEETEETEETEEMIRT